MTNTSCYDVDGIRYCVPVDAEKFGAYGLIGLAVLLGVAFLVAVAVNDAAIIGTELLNGSGYYFGL